MEKKVRRISKTQLKWTDQLHRVTDEKLAVSEVLANERAASDAEYPKIVKDMAALESDVRAAYQEYFMLLATSAKSEYKRRQEALDKYEGLVYKRDGMMQLHKIRRDQLYAEIDRLNGPIRSEIFDLLSKEIFNLKDKVIFTQGKSVNYENDRGIWVKIQVTHNFSAIEKAREVMLAVRSKIQSMTFDSIGSMLDYLDGAFAEYAKIDLGKTEKEDWDPQRVRDQIGSLRGEKNDPLLVQAKMLSEFSAETQRVIDKLNLSQEIQELKTDMEKYIPRKSK